MHDRWARADRAFRAGREQKKIKNEAGRFSTIIQYISPCRAGRRIKKKKKKAHHDKRYLMYVHGSRVKYTFPRAELDRLHPHRVEAK